MTFSTPINLFTPDHQAPCLGFRHPTPSGSLLLASFTLAIVATFSLSLFRTGIPVAWADETEESQQGTHPAAATPPAVDVKMEPVVEGSNYRIEIGVAPGARVGVPSHTVLRLGRNPKSPYKYNTAYPARIRLESASEALAMALPRLVHKDALSIEDEGALFRVEYTPLTAGTGTINAAITFGVCTETRCQIIHKKKNWDVTVLPAEDGTTADQDG